MSRSAAIAINRANQHQAALEKSFDAAQREIEKLKLDVLIWRGRFLNTAQRLSKHQNAPTFVDEDRAIVDAARLLK